MYKSGQNLIECVSIRAPLLALKPIKFITTDTTDFFGFLREIT